MDLAVTAEPRVSEDSLRDDQESVEHLKEENKFQKAIAAWRSTEATLVCARTID